MPLIKRLSRAFTADLHAVLDSIEEPSALLNQAIREMEEALLSEQKNLVQQEWLQQQQHNTETENRDKLQRIDEEIEISFANQQDSLARKAIKRKLLLQQSMESLQRQQLNTKLAIQQNQQRLQDYQEKLESMKQKQAAFVGLSKEFERGETWATSEYSVSDDEVEIAFLKEQQMRAGK